MPSSSLFLSCLCLVAVAAPLVAASSYLDHDPVLQQNMANQELMKFVAQNITSPMIAVSAVPGQLRLSLSGNAGEMVVRWVTAGSSATSTVLYDTSSHAGSIVEAAYAYNKTGTSSQYSLLNIYHSPYIHTVLLSGLLPNTKYFYRSGDHGGGYSDEMWFLTPPARAANVTLRAVVLGDHGVNAAAATTGATLAKQFNAANGVNLYLHAGDLAYAYGWQPKWDIFGGIIAPYASQVPYMTAQGNHEVLFDATAYRARMAPPFVGDHSGSNTSDYYSFDWPPASSPDEVAPPLVHVIALNSEIPYCTDSPQYKWYMNDITNVKNQRTKLGCSLSSASAPCPWVVVMFHRPFYTSNNHHGNNTMMRSVFDASFADVVDVVITGHVHCSERMHPLKNGAVVADGSGGTTHIIVGNPGNNEGLVGDWEAAVPPMTAFRDATFYGFGTLDVSATSMTYTSYASANGQVKDSVVIRRGA